MAGLLTGSSLLMCPHGGTVQIVSTDTRVKASGDFVLRSSDAFLIVGCPFLLGNVYHPCTTINWVVPTFRSKAMGDATLSEESVGMCQAADQAVQGTVLVNFTQPRAEGQ
jgi:hypothetical protein